MRIRLAISFVVLCGISVQADLPRVRVVEGHPMISLRSLARSYSMPRSVEGAEMRWQRGAHEWVFERGSRRLLVNGVVVWLHGPVRQTRWNWWLSEVDARTVVDPLMRPQRPLQAVGHQRIMLDPGHGGTDPGGRGPPGLVEKELTLEIAQRTAGYLRAAGYVVELSRAHDQTLSLAERVALAGSMDADLLVSIHFNAAANPDAEGVETFVLTAGGQRGTHDPERPDYAPAVAANRFDAAQMLLGFAVQRSLLEETGAFDRGLRRSRFFVLREATVPSILVEAGFLTHAGEGARLRSDEYRDRVARGLADGIAGYLQLVVRAHVEWFDE